MREILASYQMLPEVKEGLREWAESSGTDHRAAWATASDACGLLLLASDAILQLQRRDPVLAHTWYEAYMAATGWTPRVPGALASGPTPDLETFRAAFDYVRLADELGLP